MDISSLNPQKGSEFFQRFSVPSSSRFQLGLHEEFVSQNWLIFDRVLNPASVDAPVLLIRIPVLNYPIYLDNLAPAFIHNVWTMVAAAILVVFAESALRHAHVIARRIASVMRHTMLDREHESGNRIEAMVTLACLKATDTPQSLLARVSEPATVAAE
jgi:hypothetical protein